MPSLANNDVLKRGKVYPLGRIFRISVARVLAVPTLPQQANVSVFKTLSRTRIRGSCRLIVLRLTLMGAEAGNKTGFPLYGVETHTADERHDLVPGVPQQEKAALFQHTAPNHRR